jgi:hypothetical protein
MHSRPVQCSLEVVNSFSKLTEQEKLYSFWMAQAGWQGGRVIMVRQHIIFPRLLACPRPTSPLSLTPPAHLHVLPPLSRQEQISPDAPTIVDLLLSIFSVPNDKYSSESQTEPPRLLANLDEIFKKAGLNEEEQAHVLEYAAQCTCSFVRRLPIVWPDRS